MIAERAWGVPARLRRYAGFVVLLIVAAPTLLGCRPLPEPYSCTADGEKELAVLERVASEFDDAGKAVGSSSCDSYVGAVVSAYTAGTSVADSFAAVARSLECPDVDATELKTRLEVRCSHEGRPVKVTFDVDSAIESVNVVLEPLDPDDRE